MLTRRGLVAVFLRRRHASIAWHVCAIDRAQACCFSSMEVVLPPGCMEMPLSSDVRMLNEAVLSGGVVA